MTEINLNQKLVLFMLLREKIAAFQHETWSEWMLYLFSVCQLNEDGSATIPRDKVERWKLRHTTDWDNLSEQEKEAQRKKADEVSGLMRDAAKEILRSMP